VTLREVDRNLVSIEARLVSQAGPELRQEVHSLLRTISENYKSAPATASGSLGVGTVVGGVVGMFLGPIGSVIGAGIGGTIGLGCGEPPKHEWKERIARAEALIASIDQRRKQINQRPRPKSAGEERPFVVAVAGVTFDGRQAAVQRMRRDDRVCLTRQPDNASDRNAIAVRSADGAALGWLPRVVAEQYAPYMDGGGILYGRVLSVVGGVGGKHFGLRLLVGRAPIPALSQHGCSGRAAPPSSPCTSEHRYLASGSGWLAGYGYEDHDCGSEWGVCLDPLDDPRDERDEFYDEDRDDDPTPEGLGIGDVTFEDADLYYYPQT
jgi:HIRAN domain